MRRLIAIIAALTVGLVAGCQGQAGEDVNVGSTRTYGPDVVHLDGLDDTRFGTTRQELSDRLNRSIAGCSPQLTGVPEASLVFSAEEELVLVWFNTPLATPEGVATGDAVAKVRSAYPAAAELNAPPDSYRFDGLLVVEGDRGYLFLHDGKTVQKAIAGYAVYLQRLFDTGFGAC